MEVGVHLPQLDLDGAPLTLHRVVAVVEAARRLGLAAVSANDHFTFSRPWADGLTLLAAVAERAGPMDLVTSVGLPTLRGPVPYAAAVRTLATLAEGRVVAGIGPGSSPEDHELVGVPWEERWSRFEEAGRALRDELGGVPGVDLWLASWGSAAGLRRVARYGDGWVASAHHCDPDRFGAARRRLEDELVRAGRDPQSFPHALVTAWTWITDDPSDADRARRVLAAALGRDPTSLRDRVCVGTAEECIGLLGRYVDEGCTRVHVWPLGDEPAQLARFAEEVLPRLDG